MTDGLDQDLWKGKTPSNTPMVSFDWRDIRSTDHWGDDSEAIRPARRITSAGYLLYDGIDPGDPEAEIIVLGNHYDWEEESWSEFTCFPKFVPRWRYG
jgi:hypothetical protein